MAKRRVIALLLNNAGLRDDYQAKLRRGVEEACAERNIDLWVYAGRTDFSPSADAQLRVFELLSAARVDGIIVAAGCIATGHGVAELVRTLRARCPVPMCAVGQECTDVPSIVVNNRRGGDSLAEHLVAEHGRRRFAYIGGPSGHQESEERLLGIRDALARHGLTLDDDAVGHGDFMARSGAEVVSELIARGCVFDALLAANDNMAQGAHATLSASGLVCPADVAVVGFDDGRNARITRPALTTVRQPVVRMGMLAVGRIVAAWKGRGSARLITLGTELVVRESCGCRPAHTVADARQRPGHVDPAAAARAHIAALLAPVIEGNAQRRRWARALCDALERAADDTQALPKAISGVLAGMAHPLVPAHEVHRVLCGLRSLAPATATNPSIEASFNEACALVAAEAARREADRSQRQEAMLIALRLSGEHLSTTLTLEDLATTLLTHLPRFGIKSATVALYSASDPTRLEPLVSVVDGCAVESLEPSYSAELLLPAGALEGKERCSLTVLPLTFQVERLGVAVLGLPLGLELSTLLREQIGGAIKTVATHQERLKQERREAQTQEEKRVTAERLRSLHLIAGGVAHDLNNVLGPLLALPDAILRELEERGPRTVSSEVFEDLETIRRAGQRAAVTIRDLLSLGQPTTTATTTLDLNRLLRDEGATLRSLCDQEAEIVLRIVTAERPLLVCASKPHLVRALSNLVLNAVDAIRDRGVITIRAFERSLGEPLEGIERVDPGSYAVIEVADTGAGIPPEHLPRVLEPFFTARQRPSSTGTGLGLTIVQRIVKDCEGFLRVESEVGKGTTFSLYFPARVGRPSSISNRPPPVVGGRGRILVVDDEVGQLRTARRILTQLGYEIVTAQSGEEALELYAKATSAGAFDLVVIDLLMPGGIGGKLAVERMRALHSAQPVVMVSGWAPEQMDAISKDRGVTWLPKPYSMSDLASAVQHALVARPPLPLVPRAAS